MPDAGLYGWLGLAARAGQLVSGDYACERMVRGGEAVLLMVDANASANTRKKYADACVYHKVPLYIIDAGRLGEAIGRQGRMTVAMKPGTLAQKVLACLGPSNG